MNEPTADQIAAYKRTEFSCTLEAEEGVPFYASDVGSLCTNIDKLMREVAKSIDPKTPITVTVEHMAIAGRSLRVDFRVVEGRKPRRKRA